MASRPKPVPGYGLAMSVLALWCVVAIVIAVRHPLRAEPGEAVASVEAIEGRTIDINSASAAEFRLLPQIGPVLAERIALNRNEHGRFSSVDDLQRVSGIGPKTIERIRQFVRCSVGPDG